MSVLFLMVVFLSMETMPISPWMQTSFSITFWIIINRTVQSYETTRSNVLQIHQFRFFMNFDFRISNIFRRVILHFAKRNRKVHNQQSINNRTTTSKTEPARKNKSLHPSLLHRSLLRMHHCLKTLNRF